MQLRSVKPGDIVRCGTTLHAVVIHKDTGRLHVRHLFPHGYNTHRWVKASDVTAHWSRRS